MKFIFCYLLFVLFVSGNGFAKDRNKVFSLSKLFLNFVKNKGEYVLEKSGGNSQCAKDLKMLLADFIFAKKWALESKFYYYFKHQLTIPSTKKYISIFTLDHQKLLGI